MAAVTPIDSEIRESTLDPRGAKLELLVNGTVVATAQASGAALDAMHETLGINRDAVVDSLRQALLATLTLPEDSLR
jgi:hypothetical protein